MKAKVQNQIASPTSSIGEVGSLARDETTAHTCLCYADKDGRVHLAVRLSFKEVLDASWNGVEGGQSSGLA